MDIEQIDKAVKEVVFNKEKYSTYYLMKFGLSQPNISNLRNGKRNINNLTYTNIKRILDAYNAMNN